jgi:hypothetical protein
MLLYNLKKYIMVKGICQKYESFQRRNLHFYYCSQIKGRLIFYVHIKYACMTNIAKPIKLFEEAQYTVVSAI